MIATAFLFISSVPVIILLFLTRYSYVRGHRLITAVAFATSIYYVILFSFPVWYSALTNFHFEGVMNISSAEYGLLSVILGEIIFVAVFCISIVSKRINTTNSTFLHTENDRRLLISITIIGFLIVCYKFQSSITNLTDMINRSQGVYYNNLSGMLFSWMEGIFQMPAIVTSAIILYPPKKVEKYSLIWRLVAISVLLIVALQALTMGIRGRVVTIVIILAIVGYINKRKQPLYFGVAIMLVAASLFTFLGGPMRSLYFSGDSDLSRLELMSSIYRAATGSQSDADQYGEADNRFLFKLAERAQAPRNSIVLYEQFDSGNLAGLWPILTAVYLPIPRVIWANKRPAGSASSETYGAATYVVRKAGYEAYDYNMGPYLTSSHAYWEGGWPWLIMMSIVTASFLKAVLSWAEKKKSIFSLLVVMILMQGLVSNGFLTIFQPVFEYIRYFWVMILPLLIIKIIIGNMFAHKRYQKHIRSRIHQ